MANGRQTVKGLKGYGNKLELLNCIIINEYDEAENILTRKNLSTILLVLFYNVTINLYFIPPVGVTGKHYIRL